MWKGVSNSVTLLIRGLNPTMILILDKTDICAWRDHAGAGLVNYEPSSLKVWALISCRRLWVLCFKATGLIAAAEKAGGAEAIIIYNIICSYLLSLSTSIITHTHPPFKQLDTMQTDDNPRMLLRCGFWPQQCFQRDGPGFLLCFVPVFFCMEREAVRTNTKRWVHKKLICVFQAMK